MAEGDKKGSKWESEEGQMAGIVLVYLAHYIFMNTKELNSYFKDTSGIRLKRRYFFVGRIDQQTIFSFSRQRYGRLIRRIDSHVSEKDRQKWEEQFNIKMDFFYMGDGGTVLNCNFREWKEYFSTCYPNDSELMSGKPKEERFRAAANLPVTKALQDMMTNIYKLIGTPIYNLYYYMKFNKRYEAESNLQSAMGLLKNAPVMEWEPLTEEESDRYLRILEKHYDYIRMKKRIREIEAEDREKNKKN